MEVLAFSVFTYISEVGTQIKRSAILYSKLDRKFRTTCFSLASDPSEIWPSILKQTTDHVKNPNFKNVISFVAVKCLT